MPNVSLSRSTTGAPSWRRVLRRYGRTPSVAWAGLVLACIGSRLATTITYIEDPDSMRFALSVVEGFDVVALQPHFPGYPVFWGVAKAFYLLTGRFSVAFSLVGGTATALLIWAALRLRRVSLRSVEGTLLATLIFFTPLLWLMGNRYMPDLLGTAVALTTLVFLLRTLPPERSPSADWPFDPAVVGMVLAGLLAGLRLSYLPLVLPAVAGVLWSSPRRGQAFVAGTIGVLVWLVPMVIDTGLGTLIDVAWGQTTGHFTDFGGTVQTHPDLLARLSGLIEGLWAHGLGGWWPGRHALTAVVGVGLLGTGAVGTWHLSNIGSSAQRRRFLWLGACCTLYLVWIFLFQNVVHKSRHVLPLLPFLLMGVAAGSAGLWRWRSGWSRGAVGLFLAAFATVTLVLVYQHRSPTAIAQAKSFVDSKSRQGEPVRVASVPLVNDFLRAQQVEVQYLSVEDSADVRRLREAPQPGGQTLVIGTYASVVEDPPDRVRTFYHNPYVNRMWPEVTVYVHEH